MSNNCKTGNHCASTTPEKDVKLLTYPGQPANMRIIERGFENFMNEMPLLVKGDQLLPAKVRLSKEVMQTLARKLQGSNLIGEVLPDDEKFNRVILAMESPETEEFVPGSPVAVHEGAEIVMAAWGDNYTSPVHGHAPGYLHEEIILGKMRVSTFRIVDEDRKIVRPIKVELVTEGTFASQYNEEDLTKKNERRNLVHSFTAIGKSVSLHFLPEHTRDGRDNRFSVEYFDEMHDMRRNMVTRITGQEGMRLKIGEVVLVRSQNVPELDDHFIVITGVPVIKEHGMRPQDVAIPTSPNGGFATALLDQYKPQLGLTLLVLGEEMREEFLKFHGITVDGAGVIFPEA